MLRILVVAFGLISASAFAADVRETADDEIDAALTAAGPLKKALDDAKADLEKDKSEAEKAADERLKALEAAQAKMTARVVVLRWPGAPEVNDENQVLQRNVKVRLGRPDAKFYPEIDLYQVGRQEPDRSIHHTLQRAEVPDDVIPPIMAAVEETLSIPWNGMDEQSWGLKAQELLQLSEEIWFVDRVELREPLFLLYAAIGYAAENWNNSSPPFFDSVAGHTVNKFYYLAGSLAHKDPSIMAILTNQDLNSSVRYYKEQLDDGVFRMMTLSFEDAGQWDMKKFGTDYELFINGLPELISHPKGLFEVPPGRVDVYLKRSDGHSLSDRIELVRLEDKIYGVRDTARQRMGNEFIDMLMEHPNECVPELAGDILVYLAIYQKLHPEAEIYVVIPEAGSANRIYLWRWVASSGTLQKVLDDTGGFPVRFVGLIGGGMIFGGASYSPPSLDNPYGADLEPGSSVPPADAPTTDDLKPEFAPAGVPIFYHLRLHYARFMVTLGLEYAANIEPNSMWVDRYQTDRGKDTNELDGFKEEDHEMYSSEEACVGDDGDKECTTPEVLRQRAWQRLVNIGFGVVLGRDAALGFGPRGYIRTGWYNAPHAIDITGHVGYAAEMPGEYKGRVRPIGDADFFAGALIPFADTKYDKPMVTLGVTLSAGITF
ncbi:MAG: hypothetical protein HN348_21410 [Proteobacteria bacterium]|nr:hypothetical protein [Pseudomonadota bacterium]